ncbi:type II toxin-antitoxin system prevent-host-death family antitoxin [Candidatus Peregrinibacteria bacterium]|nr:type II toxin-antitoxin system prevent-host-death family antitoxin [Candidatus Peregrinibacteria bacterium]MBI3816321.1 type II toxin-antitoxin system prevent-host-death family antitoxin [Candidatus Peregrinibacteria bacterium]
MTTVGSYEAKTHLPKLLTRAAQGEKILVTRRGVPVALLSPPPQQDKKDVATVVEEMLAFRDSRKLTLGKLTARQLIEEGRRF